MINIEINKQWEDFEKIFGKSVLKRYEWFLNEFGRKVTKLFMKNLGFNLSDLPGGKEYKKKLVLAEFRDKSKISWFGVVVKGIPLKETEYDSSTTIFDVVPRFSIKGDPVYEILYTLGPWTAETIPFVPSARQGQAVARVVEPDQVDRTREKNFENADKTKSAMIKFGIPLATREEVYSDLHVVGDFEVLAVSLEFGLVKGAKPAWRPSLRWLRKNSVKALCKDRELTRVWTDPNFKKYRVNRKGRVKLNIKDLERIREFQNKVRV